MQKNKTGSFIFGFLTLFIIYHIPDYYPSFRVNAICKTGVIAAAAFIAWMQGFGGLAGYGLPLNRGIIRILAVGLAIGILFFTLAFYAGILAGFEELFKSFQLLKSLRGLPYILLVTSIPSMAEDILTRGYIYAHLGKYMKPASWILVSATLFVLNHYMRLGDGAAVLSYLFLFGLVLAYALVSTRSLWSAFGIHWGANIAFEFLRANFPTNSLVSHAGSTWILAGGWGTLLILMILLYKGKTGNSPGFEN